MGSPITFGAARPTTKRAKAGADARKGGYNAERVIADLVPRWRRDLTAVLSSGGPPVRMTGPTTAKPTGKGTVDWVGIVCGTHPIGTAVDVKSSKDGHWYATDSALKPHQLDHMRAVASIPGCWAGVLVCLDRDTAPRWELRRMDATGVLAKGRIIDPERFPIEVIRDVEGAR